MGKQVSTLIRNRGTAGIGYRGEQGSGYAIRDKEGNIYAGRDGNVYKRDESGNWSNVGGNSPTQHDVSRDRASSPSVGSLESGSSVRQGLDHDYQARTSGNARASSYAGRGGGFRGGGGRRR